MKSKAAVRRIVEELKVLYPNARCSLEYKKDYELLFAVRLSAQCTDARVNMVTPSLYQKFPTLEAFANATYEEVGNAIRSCGFYNTKSKDIVECAKILLEKYGGKVPGTMEELTVRHALHPHHGPPRPDGRQQGPAERRKAAARHPAAGGVERLLPPDGALRTRHLHRAQGKLRWLPAQEGLRLRKGAEIISSKKRLCRFLEKAALRSVPRRQYGSSTHAPREVFFTTYTPRRKTI